jgi:hypothetical protein
MSNILTADAVASLRNFATFPQEIRPLITDVQGKNAQFNIDDVDDALRESVSLDKNSGLAVVFKKNTAYFPQTQIFFTEKYDEPESENYASGYVCIPQSMLFDDITDKTPQSVRNTIVMNVYATPVLDNFKTLRSNDIIFIDENDVVVETRQA